MVVSIEYLYSYYDSVFQFRNIQWTVIYDNSEIKRQSGL